MSNIISEVFDGAAAIAKGMSVTFREMVTAIKAAGGSIAGDPRPFRNTGVVIGIAIDPAGNRLELIQRP